MQQNTRNYATHLETHTPPILNVARRLEVLYQQTALIDRREWCAEISELEDEITASPATSLSEAAVQMMLASAYVERAREDLVDDGACPDDIVRNAPEATHGFFTVPKVVE